MLKTTKEGLVLHLKNDLGIASSDIVFLHSGIIGLGKLEGGTQSITQAFLEVLREGTLILPTFSYSWCNGTSYDPLTSPPSGMGSYVDSVWRQEQYFVRSRDPNFSVTALKTPHNEKLISELLAIGPSCFGEQSIFGTIYRACSKGAQKGHVLLLGGAFGNYKFHTTVIHYVEERVQAPYRFQKRFYNPDDEKDFIEQGVRYLSLEEYRKINGKQNAPSFSFPISANYTRLGTDLECDGLLKLRPFGISVSRMCGYREFCDYLADRIQKDPLYCLQPALS